MDRSNLLIGAGVLVGLGTLAYWLMNRDSAGSGKTVRSAIDARTYAAAAQFRPNAIDWRSAQTRAAVQRPSADVLSDEFQSF